MKIRKKHGKGRTGGLEKKWILQRRLIITSSRNISADGPSLNWGETAKVKPVEEKKNPESGTFE